VDDPEADALLARPALRDVDLATLLPAARFDLGGRTALVTGAAGEIGGWLAAALGAAGARVALVDRDLEGLEDTAAHLGAAGVQTSRLALDLTAPGAPARVLEALGPVDVLVNNAAINRREPLLEVAPETYDEIMAVDLRAPYLLAQAVARAGRPGAIVNVGSITVAVGLQGVSVYGAAKAALAQLTKTMAVEWAGQGVRANCLCPGFMATRLSAPVWRDPSRRRWMRDRIPAGRPGRPDELSGALLLLASDAGSYLTGQTLFVDGGFLAGSTWD